MSRDDRHDGAQLAEFASMICVQFWQSAAAELAGDPSHLI
jgi:hypothetical protein